jgi:enediyne biosynthesis protein E4
MDGDGDLDLFVGGQVLSGGYPAPCSSRIFRQSKDKWSLDAENSQTLTNIGMVNGAVWSDLDGDGFPELILACEWGPIRILHNTGGTLTLWDPRVNLATFQNGQQHQMPLHQLTGLWQGVTTGDFDGDGQLDFVASNWGLNSCWRTSLDRPLTVFYGDLAGRNATDILEAEYDARGQLVPRALRDTVASAVPWLAERFPTHASWSRANVLDVIGDRRDRMRELNVATLATTIFLNRKDHFEAKPLPSEAQFAPAFGVCVADFDGDGFEDIFLAQNFFAFRVEDARLDAGRGLLLRGDGKGDFESMPGQTSGIEAHGEQRSAAAADFDHDGRLDLIVAQNGSATKLFHNQRARTGLRIRVTGPTQNPDGIGAILRLKFNTSWGPAREIHSGSGYWSQDSPVLILPMPEQPKAIQVLWPGGRKTEQPIPAHAPEVIVAP